MMRLLSPLEYEHYACDTHRQSTGDQVWHWSIVGDDHLVDSGWIHTHNDLRMRRLRTDEPRREYGLDGLALDKNGTYHGIQVKLRSKGYLRAEELGTFFSTIINRLMVKNPASRGFIYTNSNLQTDLRDDLKNSKMLQLVRLNAEVSVTEDGQPEIRLRKYQNEALRVLRQGWVGFGSLNMPCGTGKTEVFGHLSADFKKIIIVSPLRVSARQNYDRVSLILGNEYKCLLVDSDGGGAIRDVDVIRRTFYDNDKVMISSTYASALDVVREAITGVKAKENVLVVIDEAHNITQDLVDVFAGYQVLLSTATPPKSMRGEDEQIDVWDKDPLFQYSFSDAIEDGYICDYEVRLPYFQGEVKDKIGMQAQFLLDGMLRTGARRTIVYCSNKKECAVFEKAFARVAQEFHGLRNEELWMGRVTEDVSPIKREQILKEFQGGEGMVLRILTSVRILDEAVDVPNCDSVLILNTSNKESSWIRLIQRMSRAIRLDATNPNKVARVFIWVDDLEKVPDCFRLLKEQDPNFVKKVYVQGESYTEGWTRNADEVKTGATQERYRVQCLTREEIMDIRIGMLIKYHEDNGRWPPRSYTTEEGFLLGRFLDKLKQKRYRLSDEQRQRLEERDSDVLVVKKVSEEAKSLNMNQKIQLLLDYYDKEGKWPSDNFKTENGFRLGTFLYGLKKYPHRLTIEQRKLIEDIDQNVFIIAHCKISSDAKSLTTDEKVQLLIEYYERESKWPPQTFKTQNGFCLGSFLHKLKAYPQRLTTSQRHCLEEKDPNFFAIVNRVSEEVKALSLNDKIQLLIEYFQENKKWPPQKFRTQNNYCLGRFFSRLKENPDSLTPEQKHKLEQIDPNILYRKK